MQPPRCLTSPRSLGLPVVEDRLLPLAVVFGELRCPARADGPALTIGLMALWKRRMGACRSRGSIRWPQRIAFDASIFAKMFNFQV